MLVMMKKELRLFVKNKVNLAFVIIVPIVVVLIFSALMDNYIGNNTNTEELSGKVVCLVNKAQEGNEYLEDFRRFADTSSRELGIVYEEYSDYDKAVEKTDKQDAIAVVTVEDDGVSLYRTAYNRTDSAELFKAVMEEGLGNDTDKAAGAVEISIGMPSLNASAYYTFVELGFMILYIAVMVAHSVYSERSSRTINRIYLSKSGILTLLTNKFFIAMIMSVIQIAVVYLFSNIVLDVDWGEKTLMIIVVYLCLGVFAGSLGISAAMTLKKRTSVDNLLLYVAILCGYMGGAFTPVSVLESKKVIGKLIKIDPLYWASKAVMALNSGKYTSDVTKSIVFSLSAAAVFSVIAAVVYKKNSSKEGNLCAQL